jgi:hypothetical protein
VCGGMSGITCHKRAAEKVIGCRVKPRVRQVKVPQWAAGPHRLQNGEAVHVAQCTVTQVDPLNVRALQQPLR